MAKVSRIPSGEVLFEVEDPITLKTIQIDSYSVDLRLQRLDQPDMPKGYPGINVAKITIPNLDGGKYKYALVSKFTSKLDPTITKERVSEGEFTIPEATDSTSVPLPTESGTGFGSALGVPFNFELELNGQSFPQAFNLKVNTDLVPRLSDEAALKYELTFFLTGKDTITQNIARKFSGPDIDKDPELKQVAGEIIAKTQKLSSDIKSTQDITLFSNPDNHDLLDELATVILANNVVFPPSSGAPPISASGDPLSDESMKKLADTIYQESDAVEDKTEQIKKEAKKLQALMDKNKHDMQGLLTIIQTPINDENAIKLRDLFINQIGHFEKDLDETIEETKKLMASKTELTVFEKLKGDIEAEVGPNELRNTEFHENMFKTDKGKKLFRSYAKKIKNANDIIAEHNSDIIKIKDEVKKIDLAQVNAQITRLAGLENTSGEFKNWIEGFIPGLERLSKPDEIKTWITNDTVSHLNNASKGFSEAKADINAVLNEIKETNRVIRDITKLHQGGRKSTKAFSIGDWFHRKSSRLDDVVSDIKTQEVKMRELLSAGTAKTVTKTVTTTDTATSAATTPKTEATAITTTNVNKQTSSGKGNSSTNTVDTSKKNESAGGKSPGTGGSRPTTVTPRPTRYKFEGDALAIYTALKTRAQNTIDDLEHAAAGTTGKKRVSTLKNIFNPSKAVHKATLENEGLDHIPWGDFKKELNQFKKSYWKDSWASESEMEEDIKNKRRIAFISKGKLIEIKRRYDTHAASDINMMKSHQEDILNAVKVDIDGVMNEVDKLLRQLDLQRRENKAATGTKATTLAREAATV